MDDLSLVTTSERLSDLEFRATIPDGWQQGKGAFGGLVLGMLTRAMETAHGNAEWPLRVLNGEILAPVLPGDASVHVEVLRRGSGLSSYSARLSQNGELLARATALFGKQRVADRERTTLAAPRVEHWKDLEPVPAGSGLFPAFTEHFEFRPTGALPFSGASQPQAEGWISPRGASKGLGATEIVAMADAWWPADFATEPAPRPMSTIAFTLEIMTPLTGAPVRPLFHRATVPSSHGGFSVEFRELWDEEGKLVALNQQTYVFIR